ncbi:hypothetical protein [Micromonospora lutea]|uniref:hypothetical protein n=1 Tax=Micromonospora lutea TaxID=419825 RepID=UPI00194DE47F|nr:hypothetical protein [Micromonospora lutea]
MATRCAASTRCGDRARRTGRRPGGPAHPGDVGRLLAAEGRVRATVRVPVI